MYVRARSESPHGDNEPTAVKVNEFLDNIETFVAPAIEAEGIFTLELFENGTVKEDVFSKMFVNVKVT